MDHCNSRIMTVVLLLSRESNPRPPVWKSQRDCSASLVFPKRAAPGGLFERSPHRDPRRPVGRLGTRSFRSPSNVVLCHPLRSSGPRGPLASLSSVIDRYWYGVSSCVRLRVMLITSELIEVVCMYVCMQVVVGGKPFNGA